MKLHLIFPVLLVVLSILSASAGSARNQSDRIDELIQAAQSGDIEAQCELGLAYYYGRGVLKDPLEAKCWIKRAHENGSEEARTIYNDLQLWKWPGTCEISNDDSVIFPQRRGGDRFNDPVSGMEFVWIPDCCFDMGCFPSSGKCDKDTLPAHKVCLSGFWMGQTEVTQAQWEAVMKTRPSHFSKGRNYPVETVSFNDIQQFIETLNQNGSQIFDLPSEAQWEYACRGGKESETSPFSSHPARPRANCGTCDSGSFRGRTSPVGSFPPNRIGLYDMGGNVREWCKDVYDQKAYARHPLNNPVWKENASGSRNPRVVRGGSWTDTADQSGCMIRKKSLPDIGSHNTGFRLVIMETP